MGRTNIELKEEILKEAMELTKIKTKKELVNFAISELVNKLRRRKILELEGKINWEGNLEEMREDKI